MNALLRINPRRNRFAKGWIYMRLCISVMAGFPIAMPGVFMSKLTFIGGASLHASGSCRLCIEKNCHLSVLTAP